MTHSLQRSEHENTVGLAQRWQLFREENPKVRIRDAAASLGVSEAELVATGCGSTATRLHGDWGALVDRLHELGEVMALTRNEHAVHEKTGSYARLSRSGAVGVVLGEIDLRLFFSRWHLGFAVREEGQGGTRHSLQFFDASGMAVHKVYLTAGSDQAAYERLTTQYRHADQSPLQPVLPAPRPMPPVADAMIDAVGLAAHWRALQDTHDFADLLTRFGADRVQAFRLVGGDLARRVGLAAPSRVLETCAAAGLDLMLFVASPGAVQIHTGPVHNLKALGPWFNVLDERFSLHLRETALASAWVVHKPTRDGVVTSLEVFDGNGALVCQLFGRRKPGQAEDLRWRETLAALPDAEPGGQAADDN